jgi:hypothetical protein
MRNRVMVLLFTLTASSGLYDQASAQYSKSENRINSIILIAEATGRDRLVVHQGSPDLKPSNVKNGLGSRTDDDKDNNNSKLLKTMTKDESKK